MKLVINDIILHPDEVEEEIYTVIKEKYHIDFDFECTMLRKSLDARKKNRIVYRYRVLVELPDDMAESFLQYEEISIYAAKNPPALIIRSIPERVLIVGSGPAGLFCGLRLVEAGARVEIFERGKPIEERMKDIDILERSGILNVRSNVLFGEGGAGTYSDGKLTTRVRRQEIDWFFNKLVEFGAPRSILYEAKPHLGTDRLRGIVRRIRQRLVDAGSRVVFNESVDDFIIHNGEIAGIITSTGNEFRGNKLVLATGHSARDTYLMLHRCGIALEKKGFAVGVRIEHPSELINSIQYGKSPYRNILPAADYALTYANRATARGVYSFCMCPGGRVINSSSETDRLCINGMSLSRRDLPYSNSALVVTVAPDDYDIDVLGGIAFQRMMEEKSFQEGGGFYKAPAQRVTSFLQRRMDASLPHVSYLPGVRPANLRNCLPGWIADELEHGLRYFGTRMKGFISDQGVLIGAETRTSSPVRICRGRDYQSISLKGLFPVGEGAGYAGGIVSSAADGIRCADIIIATGAG
jgi:uncharacterized FAD-dependent dehydrogenase